MPVLPEVASIRVSPGLICPRNSARVIIESAGRSLTEPAGLFPSSLSNRVLLVSPAMRCKRTRGVLPTQSAIVGYCKVMAYSQSRLRGAHHTGKGRRAISRKVWCLWLKGISGKEGELEDLIGSKPPPTLDRILMLELGGMWERACSRWPRLDTPPSPNAHRHDFSERPPHPSPQSALRSMHQTA